MIIVGTKPDADPSSVELASALVRITATKGCPDYLKDAAVKWLSGR